MKIIKLGFWVALISFLIFVFMFGFPFIGAIIFGKFMSLIGFDISGFSPIKPCIIYGYDISQKAALYRFPFLNVILTPVAFLYMFWEIVLIWLTIIALFFYLNLRASN